MIVLAVDDEQIALDNLKMTLSECAGITEVSSFRFPKKALEWLEEHAPDIAFLDINMKQMSGLELAKQLKELRPGCAVVFVTGYSEYAVQAFQLRASGYLMKPVTAEDLRRELDHALQFSTAPMAKNSQIRVQTFGNFEVFADEKPLKFRYAKTKECFAYLVDRKGASVNTGELCAVLWEDKVDTPAMRSQLRNLLSDLVKTLSGVQAQGLIIKTRNSFAVDAEKLDCDFYRFLKQDASAVNEYMGQYMLQYSWAEMTIGYLESRKK